MASDVCVNNRLFNILTFICIVFVIRIQMAQAIGPASATTSVGCQISNITFWDFEEEEYVTLLDATICDIQCPNDCDCVLGSDGSLVNHCMNSTMESTENIRYPVDTPSATLFLANRSLYGIEQFAFRGAPLNEVELLYLNNNSISNLAPGAFEGLTNLVYLNLVNNLLSALRPGTFTGLTSLGVLEMQYNGITFLQPGVFDGLPNLEFLVVGHNRIAVMQPASFAGLISLIELDLENNTLKELQAGVFDGLVNLEELDIDENRLDTIAPGAFKGLVNLIEMDLDYNRLEELKPGVFDGLYTMSEIELDHNAIEMIPPDLFADLTNMEQMSLSHNKLEYLEASDLEGLHHVVQLHVSHNNLAYLHPTIFHKMTDIEVLVLGFNNLTEVHAEIFHNLTSLKALSLSNNRLSHLPPDLFRDLIALKLLNISSNDLNRLEPQLFKPFRRLVTLELTNNPLLWVNRRTFDGLTQLTYIYVDNYATCCFIESARCTYNVPPSPFLSCKRLLPFSFLRIVVWVVGISAIVGNLFVLYSRCGRGGKVTVQYLLITNLSLSDLIMGIYMLILISVDMRLTEYFPSHSKSWRQSTLCKVAGGLSLLSSEASVFFITLISIDRFQGIKYPFSDYRLRKTSAKILITILWLVAVALGITSALIPVFAPNLYEASEVCVGLPISRVNSYVIETNVFELNISSFEFGLDFGRATEAVFVGSKPSMFLSIAIFVVLNMICFLIVAYCYTVIFIIARKTSLCAGRTRDSEEEIRMAFKMAGIVISDFCCWMIVVVLSILVQSGTVTLNPVAYAWIATFIIPLNSCVNPFLYTLTTLISDRLQRRDTEQKQKTNSVSLSVKESDVKMARNI